MSEEAYERLAKHLNDLPAGFPKSPDRVELRILKQLFSAEEAELACRLEMTPQEAASIAERAGLTPEETSSRLAAMARKGLILRMDRGGKTHYMASQYLVGIWEYQVNSLTESLVLDMNAYIPTLMGEMTSRKTQQLRTIPISRTLPGEGAIMAYEEARQIIAQQSKIAVADCICRKEHRLVGKGCDKPLHNCLVFSSGAHYYLANGLGREITQGDALRILQDAEEAGLVLQPSNAQKVANICLCCGCCCQVLKGLKQTRQPARHVNSNFYAAADETRCVGCEICLDRCQMEAIEMVEGVARVSRDRCIGCGLCVSTCSSEALRLFSKPEHERWVPPTTMAETYALIAKERGKGLEVKT
jgi:ferredoxin